MGSTGTTKGTRRPIAVVVALLLAATVLPIIPALVAGRRRAGHPDAVAWRAPARAAPGGLHHLGLARNMNRPVLRASTDHHDTAAWHRQRARGSRSSPPTGSTFATPSTFWMPGSNERTRRRSPSTRAGSAASARGPRARPNCSRPCRGRWRGSSTSAAAAATDGSSHSCSALDHRSRSTSTTCVRNYQPWNVRGVYQGPRAVPSSCEPATNSRVDSRGTGSTGHHMLTFSLPSTL